MPPITINVEIAFDSTGTEPHPWWKPFGWLNRYDDDDSIGGVLRFGALGFHVCIAAHFYKYGPME